MARVQAAETNNRLAGEFRHRYKSITLCLVPLDQPVGCNYSVSSFSAHLEMPPIVQKHNLASVSLFCNLARGIALYAFRCGHFPIKTGYAPHHRRIAKAARDL